MLSPDWSLDKSLPSPEGTIVLVIVLLCLSSPVFKIHPQKRAYHCILEVVRDYVGVVHEMCACRMRCMYHKGPSLFSFHTCSSFFEKYTLMLVLMLSGRSQEFTHARKSDPHDHSLEARYPCFRMHEQCYVKWLVISSPISPCIIPVYTSQTGLCAI